MRTDSQSSKPAFFSKKLVFSKQEKKKARKLMLGLWGLFAVAAAETLLIQHANTLPLLHYATKNTTETKLQLLYQYPSPQAPQLRWLTSNADYKILEVREGWQLIQSGHRYGWMQKSTD